MRKVPPIDIDPLSPTRTRASLGSEHDGPPRVYLQQQYVGDEDPKDSAKHLTDDALRHRIAVL